MALGLCEDQGGLRFDLVRFQAVWVEELGGLGLTWR
jgi:hypothetical protein